MWEPPQKCLPRTTVLPAPSVRPGSVLAWEIIGTTSQTSTSRVMTISWHGASFTSMGGSGWRMASTALNLNFRGSSTSVETSSPFSRRYSRVLRRLEMSFLVGFMARTSTVKPFVCQASESGMLPAHGAPLPGARDRDGVARHAPRAARTAGARAGRARVPGESVLPSQAGRGGSQAGRRSRARRHPPPAVHDEGRAEAGSGRPSAVGNAAGRAVRRLLARSHDVGDHRTPAGVPRHARRLVRLLSLVRALAVGLRHPLVGHGDGRVLLRPVDRLLVGVLRRAGSRLS